MTYLYQWPDAVYELCPHCRGGGEPSGPNYCFKCRGKGCLLVKCDCGRVATDIVDEQGVCKECLEIKESENE